MAGHSQAVAGRACHQQAVLGRVEGALVCDWRTRSRSGTSTVLLMFEDSSARMIVSGLEFGGDQHVDAVVAPKLGSRIVMPSGDSQIEPGSFASMPSAL